VKVKCFWRSAGFPYLTFFLSWKAASVRFIFAWDDSDGIDVVGSQAGAISRVLLPSPPVGGGSAFSICIGVVHPYFRLLWTFSDRSGV